MRMAIWNLRLSFSPLIYQPINQAHAEPRSLDEAFRRFVQQYTNTTTDLRNFVDKVGGGGDT